MRYSPGLFQKGVNARIEGAVRYAMNKVLRELVIAIRQVISEPVQGSGRNAIRSEPGEPPYRESGQLWRSIQKSIEGIARSLRGRVYTELPKAVWLEFGRLDGHFEARPFFRKTWNKLRAEAVQHFRQYVAEYLRSSGHNDSDFD